jgi:hypothetical protein
LYVWPANHALYVWPANHALYVWPANHALDYWIQILNCIFVKILAQNVAMLFKKHKHFFICSDKVLLQFV